MDPLSITVAIPTLAATLLKVSAEIQSVAKAPVKVAKLRRDVQQFSYEVDILSRQLRHPRISRHLPREHVEQVLSEAQRHLNALSSTLEGIRTKSEQSREANRLAQFRGERKCREHHLQLAESIEKLRRLKELTTIDLICQISTLENPEVSRLCLAQAEAVGPTSTTSTECSQISGNESSETEASSLSKSLANDNLTEILGPLPKPAVCTCQCHNMRHLSGRRQLEALLPSIFSTVSTRCTNFRCCARSRRKSQPKIVVRPEWLQRLAIVSLASRKSSLRNSIPVRPVIPENSDASRYAKVGNASGLRRLLAQGLVVPSATTPDGWTLLHSAVYNSQPDTVRLLLNEHADSAATEDGLRTPADLARVRALMVGATKDQIDIAGFFEGAEEFKDDYHLTAVHIAALDLYDHEDAAHPSLGDILEFIDDADNAPSGTNWRKYRSGDQRSSPLFASIIETYAEWARDSSGLARTPIIDQPDSKHGWTPFFWAAYTGRKEILEVLIKSGADPFTFSEKKRNALHLAAESKDPAIMAYVLERPCYNGQWFDINHHDYWGETPLHVAAYGSAGCVKLLLEHGADRSAVQETNQVALHQASLVADKQEKLRVVDALSSDMGSHINHQDEEGRSPLFDLLDSPESVKLLLLRGANTALRDNAGRTVFHHAAIENAAESLGLLLQHEATPLRSSNDNNGKSPIEVAFEHESAASIIELLKNDAVGELQHENAWALVHYAAHLGDPGVLECVVTHRSFKRGEQTSKQESAADIAKAAGNWTGRVKDLLKAYDSKGQVAGLSWEAKANQEMSRANYMLMRA